MKRPGRVAVLLRALAAAVVMGMAFALATWLGGLAGASAGPDQPLAARIVVAGPVCVAVVGIILLLRHRMDRAPLATIGLTGPARDARGFLLGASVVLASGAAVIGLLMMIGWARWTKLDVSALIGFLAANTLVALLLEAIPEEISIRGYALTCLRQSFSTRTAAVLGIATFLLVPLIALSAGWMLEQTAGRGSFNLAPGGQDALTYYATLAAFGLMLTYARDATVAATVWSCIGAHLAWLTLNRIVLGGATGVRLELEPGAELAFFAVYTSAAVIAFSLLAVRARR